MLSARQDIEPPTISTPKARGQRCSLRPVRQREVFGRRWEGKLELVITGLVNVFRDLFYVGVNF